MLCYRVAFVRPVVWILVSRVKTLVALLIFKVTLVLLVLLEDFTHKISVNSI